MIKPEKSKMLQLMNSSKKLIIRLSWKKFMIVSYWAF
jgi:hypothetical protein